MKNIHLWGVKQNNLKNIDVEITHGSFTVICGPSGSGKSSLAFETLYAEGQRRYIESLSNYTKQFLNKAPKPDIERIENVPPAIALEQKNSVKTSRSTVGTSTEITDYLRLLYEKVGKAYCPDHHIQLESDNVVSASQKVMHTFADKRGYVLALVSQNDRSLNGRKLYNQLLQDGYLRIYKAAKKKPTLAKRDRAQRTTKVKRTTKKVLSEAHQANETLPIYDVVSVGKVMELSDPKLRKSVPKDDFYVVIDRLAFRAEDESRLIDSMSQAYKASLKYSKHVINAAATVITTEGECLRLSEDFSCSICGYTFPRITSQLFSFNSPAGACEACNGFGNVLSLDPNKVIPNPLLSLADGALRPFEMPSARKDKRTLMNFCKKAKIDVSLPWNKLSKAHQKAVWHGTKDFYGVEGLFEYLESKKYKIYVRVFLSRYKSPKNCSACKGTRLRPEAQQVLIEKHSISDLCSLAVDDLLAFLEKLRLTPQQDAIAKEVLQQLKSRLFFLSKVGVGYDFREAHKDTFGRRVSATQFVQSIGNGAFSNSVCPR